MELISDRIPAGPHKQPKDYLRILVLAVLGVSRNADVILLRLKVERAGVIERYRHPTAHDCLCVFKRDLLHLPFHADTIIRRLAHLFRRLALGAQFVEEAVNGIR